MSFDTFARQGKSSSARFVIGPRRRSRKLQLADNRSGLFLLICQRLADFVAKENILIRKKIILVTKFDSNRKIEKRSTFGNGEIIFLEYFGF